MILSFANNLADDLFEDKLTKEVRNFPQELKRKARMKLLYLHQASNLEDMRVPPGNRLEALKGNRLGFYSIRINDQWRLIFKWENGNALSVSIEDYH